MYLSKVTKYLYFVTFHHCSLHIENVKEIKPNTL